MYQITIESISFGQVEWSEVVTAKNRVAASRKAYRVVWDCGHEGEIQKRVNEFDATIEVWRLE